MNPSRALPQAIEIGEGQCAAVDGVWRGLALRVPTFFASFLLHYRVIPSRGANSGSTNSGTVNSSGGVFPRCWVESKHLITLFQTTNSGKYKTHSTRVRFNSSWVFVRVVPKLDSWVAGWPKIRRGENLIWGRDRAPSNGLGPAGWFSLVAPL